MINSSYESMLHQAQEDLAEHEATFALRWNADQRAIKRWQEAHPGNDKVWPDHTDLVAWLMEQLEASKGFSGRGGYILMIYKIATLVAVFGAIPAIILVNTGHLTAAVVTIIVQGLALVVQLNGYISGKDVVPF
jgi:hypothetical protein